MSAYFHTIANWSKVKVDEDGETSFIVDDLEAEEFMEYFCKEFPKYTGKEYDILLVVPPDQEMDQVIEFFVMIKNHELPEGKIYAQEMPRFLIGTDGVIVEHGGLSKEEVNQRALKNQAKNYSHKRMDAWCEVKSVLNKIKMMMDGTYDEDEYFDYYKFAIDPDYE